MAEEARTRTRIINNAAMPFASPYRPLRVAQQGTIRKVHVVLCAAENNENATLASMRVLDDRGGVRCGFLGALASWSIYHGRVGSEL